MLGSMALLDYLQTFWLTVLETQPDPKLDWEKIQLHPGACVFLEKGPALSCARVSLLAVAVRFWHGSQAREVANLVTPGIPLITGARK